MSEKVKFIRKNGRLIPIKEKSGGQSNAQKAEKYAQKGRNYEKKAKVQDKMATKFVAGGTILGMLTTAGMKGKATKAMLLRGTVGAIAGGVAARIAGYGKSDEYRSKARENYERAGEYDHEASKENGLSRLNKSRKKKNKSSV